MNWNYAYVFLASIGGSIVQTTTGFGYGIFVLVFFPLFLPFLQCTALSSVINVGLTAWLSVKYRKHIEYRSLILPLIIYIIVANIAIWISTKVDVGGLKAYFGLFLIVIAAYFMFFSSRIHLKANYKSATVCSSISGLANGLFGIGGPPMVLYYLAVAGDDKLKYLGTLQMFFLLSSINNVVARVASGIITWKLIPLVIPGLVGLIIGQKIGQKIVDRVNIDQLKKMIYGFLAISGIITFVTNI